MTTPTPTPKALTEADLAGVPRPVSTDEVMLLANWCEVMSKPPHSASKKGKFESLDAALCSLVSERDALAGRVAELEAEVERLAEIPKISTEHGPWLPSRYHEDETYCQRCLIRDKFSSARGCTPHLVYAALSTTPESKP